MGTELYPQTTIVRTSSNQTGLWPVSGSGSEIDLREEFRAMLYGSATEVPKGRPVVLRRMRRDLNGNLIRCACVSDTTREPDKDTVCSYCFGEGYLWDEEFVTSYKVVVSPVIGLTRQVQPHEPGTSSIPLVSFYVEYFVEPTTSDRIVEVKLDTEGVIAVPFKREAIFRIAVAEAFRSDNGRVEYWRLSVDEDVVKSTWQ